MGDGEFQGGGSVTWTITNTDGESGEGDRNRAQGKDRDPKRDDGVFTVTVNGRVVATEPVKGTRITVSWE